MNSYTQRDLSNSSLELADASAIDALKTVSYNRAILNNDMATAYRIMDIKPESNIDMIKDMQIKQNIKEELQNKALTDQIFAQARLKDSSMSKQTIENKLLNLTTEQKQKIKLLLPTLNKEELEQVMDDNFKTVLKETEQPKNSSNYKAVFKSIDRLAAKQKDTRSELGVWDIDLKNKIKFNVDKDGGKPLLTVKNKVTGTNTPYFLTPALYGMLTLQPQTLVDNNILLNMNDIELKSAVLNYGLIMEDIKKAEPNYFSRSENTDKIKGLTQLIEYYKTGQTTNPSDSTQHAIDYEEQKKKKRKIEDDTIVEEQKDIPKTRSKVKSKKEPTGKTDKTTNQSDNIQPTIDDEKKKDKESKTKTGKKGKGLSDKEPKIQFGKYYIDRKKLVKHKILSISDSRGLKIKGFPNMQVSNDMVKFFTNKQVNTNKYKLNDVEQIVINKLLNRADANIGVSKKKLIKNDCSQMIDILKNDLMIVCGELDAQNNNPELKKQLSEIIRKLLLLNAITQNMAVKLTQEYINNI